MIREIEAIPSIVSLAMGRSPGGELTFAYAEVLDVIKICTRNGIAVLGMETLLVRSDGYYASGSSDYDLQITQRWRIIRADDWGEYVIENNRLAEESVRRNPTGDEHVYILTTVSWSEFCETRKATRR